MASISLYWELGQVVVVVRNGVSLLCGPSPAFTKTSACKLGEKGSMWQRCSILPLPPSFTGRRQSLFCVAQGQGWAGAYLEQMSTGRG